MRALGATSLPKTLQTSGTLEGLGERGTFRYWRDGTSERDDELLGVRSQRTLRVGDREFVQNGNGDVREIRGIGAKRRITNDFIDSGEFAQHPEDVAMIGFGKTLDGRAVWRLRVAPPGGAVFGVGIDAATWMVDEKAYPEGDGITTIDYDDYRNVDGALIPFKETDSSGDAAFDVVSRTETARANAPVDPSVFAPLVSTVVDAAVPVTLPLIPSQGHIFVRGSVGGKSATFLVDSGSQGIVIDSGAATRFGLTIAGKIQLRGAERTSGGVAALDSIALGAATLPVHVASVVDLSGVACDGKTVDGILGYPFFAASEVRIDPEKLEMTIAKPGALPPLGDKVPVDTDRELPEIATTIDRVAARVLLDTGDTSELLVFHAFSDAHPGLVTFLRPRFSGNSGVGGSSAAVPAWVDSLTLGPYTMYNRYATVILASSGAFADNEDAGNVGWATLRNFDLTFDLANGFVSLAKTRWFDEGRFRARPDI